MFLLIYNASGILIGLAGVIVGGLIAANINEGLGVLMAALVWIGGGVWWRKRPTTTGETRRWPSLFFVPLPVLAVPIALAGAYKMATDKPDTREQQNQLIADFDMLRTAQTTGDSVLSPAVWSGLRAALPAADKPEGFSVFTRLKRDAVLVMMKVPDFDAYTSEARTALVNLAVATVAAQPRARDKRVYVAIISAVNLGAVRVPPDQTLVGAAADTAGSLLYRFYR